MIAPGFDDLNNAGGTHLPGHGGYGGENPGLQADADVGGGTQRQHIGVIHGEGLGDGSLLQGHGSVHGAAVVPDGQGVQTGLQIHHEVLRVFGAMAGDLYILRSVFRDPVHRLPEVAAVDGISGPGPDISVRLGDLIQDQRGLLGIQDHGHALAHGGRGDLVRPDEGRIGLKGIGGHIIMPACLQVIPCLAEFIAVRLISNAHRILIFHFVKIGVSAGDIQIVRAGEAVHAGLLGHEAQVAPVAVHDLHGGIHALFHGGLVLDGQDNIGIVHAGLVVELHQVGLAGGQGQGIIGALVIDIRIQQGAVGGGGGEDVIVGGIGGEVDLIPVAVIQIHRIGVAGSHIGHLLQSGGVGHIFLVVGIDADLVADAGLQLHIIIVEVGAIAREEQVHGQGVGVADAHAVHTALGGGEVQVPVNAGPGKGAADGLTRLQFLHLLDHNRQGDGLAGPAFRADVIDLAGLQPPMAGVVIHLGSREIPSHQGIEADAGELIPAGLLGNELQQPVMVIAGLHIGDHAFGHDDGLLQGQGHPGAAAAAAVPDPEFVFLALFHKEAGHGHPVGPDLVAVQIRYHINAVCIALGHIPAQDVQAGVVRGEADGAVGIGQDQHFLLLSQLLHLPNGADGQGDLVGIDGVGAVGHGAAEDLAGLLIGGDKLHVVAVDLIDPLAGLLVQTLPGVLGGAQGLDGQQHGIAGVHGHIHGTRQDHQLRQRIALQANTQIMQNIGVPGLIAYRIVDLGIQVLHPTGPVMGHIALKDHGLDMVAQQCLHGDHAVTDGDGSAGTRYDPERSALLTVDHTVDGEVIIVVFIHIDRGQIFAVIKGVTFQFRNRSGDLHGLQTGIGKRQGINMLQTGR